MPKKFWNYLFPPLPDCNGIDFHLFQKYLQRFYMDMPCCGLDEIFRYAFIDYCQVAKCNLTIDDFATGWRHWKKIYP